MAIKKLTSITILIFLLFSCKTTQDNAEQDREIETILTAEINKEIDSENLFRVYQLLAYYREKSYSSTIIDSAESKLNKLLPQKLENELNSGSWKDFFVTYNNLKTLGYDLASYDLQGILYRYIVENSETKLYKSGILLSEKHLDYTLLDKDSLIKLESIFRTITVEDDYPLLLNELSSRGIEVDDNKNYSNYLDGVFTVYVNMGISFKNGIGTSDIVVGSGFFIDKLGHAITNYHVIEAMVNPEYEGVNNLYIKLNGSEDKIPAKVVGWDSIMDLALIKVNTRPKFVYSINDKSVNTIGDSVVAVGSPGGLSSTVTRGIISSIDRALLQYGAVIQIDTPINPGNSGGPLIDDDKRVTNVVFAGIEEFEGVNFAVPSKYLVSSLPELYSEDEVDHVWLGAGLTKRKSKLEVIYIKPKSPAYMLNLKKGDTIEGINGIKFKSIIEIQDYLLDFSPNEIVEVEYKRDSNYFKKKICLEKRPPKPTESIINGDTPDQLYIPIFGMDIEFTGKVLWNKQYLINDVFPGSLADDLELKMGDSIIVRSWEYNKDYGVVVLFFTIMSQTEGFFEKSIQLIAPINVNFFI